VTTANPLYGLMAVFVEHTQVLEAARAAYENGYRRMDAFTPFPIEGLAEALGRSQSRLPLFVLSGGIVGGISGYVMQWYAMVGDYPMNIGGRPFHSWPAFIPIAFELTVLGAALSALIGMLALNRLPRLHHPVFGAPGFERASVDRFILCIEASDPQFDATQTRRFLERLRPESIKEVGP
jgi:hypothetical protein